MIQTDAEYEATRQYADRLQQILRALRQAHAPDEYQAMSKAYLKELARAQREITVYLSLPAPPTPSP